MIIYPLISGERIFKKNIENITVKSIAVSSVSATASSSVKQYVDIQNESAIFDEQRIDM